MTPPLLDRLRWTAEEGTAPEETPAVLARSFAYLYGAGASLVLLTLLLPDGGRRAAWAIVAIAATALAVAAMLLVRFDRLPMWVFRAMPPAGAVLVSGVVVAGGTDLVAAYATIYFWVVLSAHYFFSGRVGAANTAFVAVGYAAVLRVMPGVTDAEIKWVALTATLAIAGMLVSLLRSRVRTLFGRLAIQAFHDDLTGLPNRHRFMERLGGALARERGEGATTAVLFLDVDNFKVLNDSLGHRAGDAVLIALVPRLRAALDPGDVLARFGGDEFVALCPRIGGEPAALAVAERLHAAIEEPFAIGGGFHRLTASIGVALGPQGSAPEALLRDADAALSLAKTAGRDQTAVHDTGMHARALARLHMENALREALDLEQLRLVYQPIVDLTTGRVVACEALLRWNHPLLGEVSPAEMIPLAEETGLIVRIGRWVLGEACRAASRWRDELGPRAPAVTVNVAARQLLEPGLARDVAEALEAAGLPARSLAVEITESAMIEDSTAADERLAELRALGVHLALDDFGTGYASLSYLRRFAVDTVKIDRSFVATVEDEGGGDAIVAAVVGLTAGLGCRAVAEGIETPGQLARLRALGCPLGQGWLFARPAPADEIGALLREGLPAAAAAA